MSNAMISDFITLHLFLNHNIMGHATLTSGRVLQCYYRTSFVPDILSFV